MPNSHVSSNSLFLDKHCQIENHCVIAPVLGCVQFSSIAVPQHIAATDSFDLQHEHGVFEGYVIIDNPDW